MSPVATPDAVINKLNNYNMKKTKVLFVCEHNSARSQMAEAFLNGLAGDKFEAESAGLEPGVLNPIVVKGMEELGIDISNNQTKAVLDLFKQGRYYNFVIAVCDDSVAERCPIFPGINTKLAWNIPDPSKLEGTNEEKLEKTRVIRDRIKDKISKFIEVYNINN